MVPIAIRPLAATVAWSLPTAVLAPFYVPLAAAIAMAGLLVAICTKCRLRRCGLGALPVLLATMPPAVAATPQISRGPAWIEGRVRDVVRAPLANRNYVKLAKDLRISFPGEIELVVGDHIRVLVRTGKPAIPDVQPALQAVPATLQITASSWSFRSGCAALRRAMERELLRIVPGQNGAMLATLVLGRATQPDPELAAAHRATGLSHLLAVSGAHAAMLAFLLGMSSRGRHLGASRGRSIIVLLILLIYGGIAGAEPPVLRAVVAFMLSAIAARVGRPFGIATGLLVPAWITCLVQPDALLGASFLLSYAAVIGLAIALRGRPSESLREWLIDGLRASFWATLLTAPLTLAFFGQLAPWTILLTPLCAPLVAMMLLLGLLAACLSMVSPTLADGFAWPLHAMASTYAWLVHSAEALPGTPIPAWYRPPLWATVMVAGIAGAYIMWRPKPRSVIMAIAVIVSLWFLPLQNGSTAHFTLFAVGHGQAALAQTAQNLQIVVDCGSLQGGARAARRIHDGLTRYTIDLLVITHADLDHHNGVPHLLQRLQVLRAVMPAALKDSELHSLLIAHGCQTRLLQQGQQAQPLPGTRILAPDLPTNASDNDLSLWIDIAIQDTSILLTGDAQELGVAAALASGFVTGCDILVLPHHGRRNANAAHLLRRAQPQTCLASAATADGKTMIGTVAQSFGADLWVTGLHGNIKLTGNPARISSQQPLTRPGN